jgi:25S rRNA (uracil2634-N3)-methyltransferase
MSKTKHKRARREAKREHQKKVTKAAHTSRRASTTQSQPVAKKQKLNHTNANSTANSNANIEAQTAPTAVVDVNGKAHAHTQASQKHPIPFDVYDKVLLVGEGDFSFARSLCVEHGCANVTATSFDSGEEVREKYVICFTLILFVIPT